MRITPLDVRNHPFQRRLSGYDREEVDAFLRMVAEDYEDVTRESEGLRDEVARLKTRVGELAANEAVLQKTLTTAQKLSEDLKRNATKEAEILVGEAEINAEKILGAAHRRAAMLAEDIREMQQLRTRLAASVRAAIETHLNLLDGLAAQDADDPILEGKVRYLAQSPMRSQSGGEG
ncbi:MAG: DivIVA domain-containing protein [Myxococcota bacterium]